METVHRLTEEDLKSEQWVDVKGYENLYRISSMGRIQNQRGITQGALNRNGLLRHPLYKNGTMKSYYVHKLVAIHFIPNEQNKPYVVHTGHKTDNRHNQLMWSTHKEGAHHTKYKIQHYTRSVCQIDIDTNQVIKIYNALSDVKKDGFTLSRVSACARGESKSHKRYRWEFNDNDNERVQRMKRLQTETIEDEKWANLKDCNDETLNKYVNYAISDHGRVKNIKTGRLGSTREDQRVTLHDNGKARQFQLSRVMLLGFNVPNPENKPEIDHIDSNWKNNKLDNLRWVTTKENCNNVNTITKRVTSIPKNMKRIKVVNITTNEETAVNGVTRVESEFGVNRTTVNKYISNGRVFKNYKFIII